MPKHHMNKRFVDMFLCVAIIAFSPIFGIRINAAPNPDSSRLAGTFANSVIVYTAHQEWPSRIYLLRADGSVITYYEYDFTRLVDLEVVNNQVYVAEAFAPRAYKINLDTGNLDLIIDDWSLYYFYDLAFDGTYFYVTEWDLNRYDINGNKNGTASFDEYVLGAAWDGSYYWTLNDENQIKCWNISNWPTITEIPDNGFAPPTPDCRGLWFDGLYFWTAESIEGSLGKIYQFNYNGQVINQWTEPAFRGWSACVVVVNGPPETPHTPSGPTQGEVGIEYDFSTNTNDPEEDSIFYWFDWGDGTDSDWIGPYHSGDTCTASHVWTNPVICYVKVKAKDTHDHQSDWSDSLSVALYICGDCNSDGLINSADVVYLINYLFKDGLAPVPLEAGEVNLDETINSADVVYMINYLFKGGPPPCEP